MKENYSLYMRCYIFVILNNMHEMITSNPKYVIGVIHPLRQVFRSLAFEAHY